MFAACWVDLLHIFFVCGLNEVDIEKFYLLD